MTAHGIDLDTPAIRTFCRKWKIRELCVFGSILRDDFRPDSDIDFLVDYEDNAGWDLFDHFDMEEELAEIVGRPVDLVERLAIETSRNRLRRHEILLTAEPVAVDVWGTAKRFIPRVSRLVTALIPPGEFEGDQSR